MQTLLIKKDTNVRTAIQFLLENELDAEVKAVASMQEGLAILLDDTNKIDVLICDDDAENQKVLKYIMTSDSQVRCLILKDPNAPSVLAFPDLIVGYVNPANVTDELKKAFAEKINVAKAEAKEGDDGKYCRIHAATALQRFPLPFDLFVRLSSIKYVRVFKKGDKFTEKDIQNFLQKKGITYLYTAKEDAKLFAIQLKEDLERDFKAATATPESQTRAAAVAQEAVMELGARIGYTPEVQALAKQGMMTTVKTIAAGKQPQLAKILKNIMADKERYLGSHAVMTAQLSCALANIMQWCSETTIQKLTFAAFFHDMIILNNNLAQVKSLTELERRKGEFTEDEYKKFKLHPAMVAQIVTNFSEVPQDAGLIISQHHERSDGSGFPRGLMAANIAPLSAIFIIAHDLVDYMFEKGTKDIEAFFEEYKNKYSQGHFRKILTSIDLKKLGLAEGASPAPAKAPASAPAK